MCACVLLDRKQMDKLYFNMIAAKYFISYNTPTTNCYPKLLASTNFIFLVSFPSHIFKFESSNKFALIKCTAFLNIWKRHFSYPPAKWAHTAIDFSKWHTTANDEAKKIYMSICQIKLSSHFKWISVTFVEYKYFHVADCRALHISYFLSWVLAAKF